MKKLLSSYKEGHLSNFYQSEQFRLEKNRCSLYPPPSKSVSNEALDTNVPYEQEQIIEEFMQKKVTKRIGMDNIAIAKWFLKEYAKSSKSSASHVTTTNEQVTLVLFTNHVHDLC